MTSARRAGAGEKLAALRSSALAAVERVESEAERRTAAGAALAGLLEGAARDRLEKILESNAAATAEDVSQARRQAEELMGLATRRALEAVLAYAGTLGVEAEARNRALEAAAEVLAGALNNVEPAAAAALMGVVERSADARRRVAVDHAATVAASARRALAARPAFPWSPPTVTQYGDRARWERRQASIFATPPPPRPEDVYRLHGEAPPGSQPAREPDPE